MKNIALRRFWFDLLNWKDWTIVYKFQRLIWKIKDYDRIEYDYSCVLDHATNGKMSKTNYYLADIYSEIDDTQREFYVQTIKDDFNNLMALAPHREDIQKFIDDL